METIAPTLAFAVKYKKKDISALLAPYVTSISFTDNMDNTADTISIELEDSDDRWMGSWYPTKTDEISLSFGYLGEKALDAGAFYIDQISIQAPPSTVTIEAIAAMVTEDLKTKRSAAYENKTLKQIVAEIAKRHKLEVVGSIEDVKITRRTQDKQGDLEFLNQLANEYGYVLACKDKKLIFTKREGLKKSSSKIEITRKDCIDYSFRDTTSKVYKACEVRYWSPQQRRLISYTAKAQGLKTGDTLIIKERLESKEQAEKRAKAALTSANDRQVTADITVVGTTKYVAGAQIKLSGFGVLSGIYTVTSAAHSFSRSGWTVALSLSRNELKADDPHQETKKKGRSGSGGSGSKGNSRRFDKLSDTPWGWTTIEDDDGRPGLTCIQEFAARYARLRQLVHQRWPGRAFWVSCTTGGQHSSSHHGQGKAADCGVGDGMTADESKVLEELAHECGFDTYNEYIYRSANWTGPHMHIYIDI